MAPSAFRRDALASPPAAAILAWGTGPNNRGLVAVEAGPWPDDGATAAIVGTLPEFRDLFASEVLAPGRELTVSSLTFLFTDLSGSTAMYTNLGQARAFRLVMDHFDILSGAIKEHQGAIVKTIGDAVMAGFCPSADAMRA